MNKPIANLFAWQKGTVATLCIVCTAFMLLVSGCREKETPKIDEETFLKSLEDAPFVSVPKEELPEWLQEMIMELEAECEKSPVIYEVMPVRFYKGEWGNRLIYMYQHPYHSCIFCYCYHENGEWFSEPLLVKNWELIYQIGGKPETKSRIAAYSHPKVEDKYDFPDISRMNDWERPTIIQDRLSALQMPDALLASISTAGLLETCLEFPYLIDIHFSQIF